MTPLADALAYLSAALREAGVAPERAKLVLDLYDDLDRLRLSGTHDCRVPNWRGDGVPEVALEVRRPPPRRYVMDARLLLHDPDRRATLSRLAGALDAEQLDLLGELLDMEPAELLAA